MSEWWGGKKANLDHTMYYWILNTERSKVCAIEKNREWPPRTVLSEGLMAPRQAQRAR